MDCIFCSISDSSQSIDADANTNPTEIEPQNFDQAFLALNQAIEDARHRAASVSDFTQALAAEESARRMLRALQDIQRFDTHNTRNITRAITQLNIHIRRIHTSKMSVYGSDTSPNRNTPSIRSLRARHLRTIERNIQNCVDIAIEIQRLVTPQGGGSDADADIDYSSIIRFQSLVSGYSLT